MRFMAGGDRQLAHAMHLNTSYRELLLSSLCTDARALSASCPCHPLPPHAAEQCGGVPQHFRVCVVFFRPE